MDRDGVDAACIDRKVSVPVEGSAPRLVFCWTLRDVAWTFDAEADVGVPHVIAYKANPLTAAIVRRMLTIRYVSLVNLIADAPVTPELLQEWCTVDSLVREVARLLDDPEAADRQRQGMSSVIASLRPEGVSPSNRAASAVLDIMQDASQGAV